MRQTLQSRFLKLSLENDGNFSENIRKLFCIKGKIKRKKQKQLRYFWFFPLKAISKNDFSFAI